MLKSSQIFIPCLICSICDARHEEFKFFNSLTQNQCFVFYICELKTAILILFLCIKSVLYYAKLINYYIFSQLLKWVEFSFLQLQMLILEFVDQLLHFKEITRDWKSGMLRKLRYEHFNLSVLLYVCLMCFFMYGSFYRKHLDYKNLSKCI